MSISTENFVKHIYLLEHTAGVKLSSSMLASRMCISRAAVTNMLHSLRNKGIVIYKKYRNPTLTKKGRRMALNIIRKHRLWETFLYKTLEIPWKKIHYEAEDLEHYSSDYLIDYIDKFMNYPSFDPHGDPIPNIEGKFPQREGQKLLAEISEPGYYKITRIIDYSKELMDYMSYCRLSPDDTIYIPPWQRSKPKTIVFRDKKMNLPENVLNFIYIQPLTPKNKKAKSE